MALRLGVAVALFVEDGQRLEKTVNMIFDQIDPVNMLIRAVSDFGDFSDMHCRYGIHCDK